MSGEGDNPARWSGNLAQIFEKQSKISNTQHRPTLPVEMLPDFFNRLQQEKGISNIALSMIILTASRLKEITDARWSEYDPDSAVLTIPAERTKTGKQHRIPLPAPAVALIEQMRAWFPPDTQDAYIFSASGKPLSDVAIAKVRNKLHPGITTHGFRSTFKDWCRIHAPEFNDEVSELALSHVSSDATRAAYARDELLEQRR